MEPKKVNQHCCVSLFCWLGWLNLILIILDCSWLSRVLGKSLQWTCVSLKACKPKESNSKKCCSTFCKQIQLLLWNKEGICSLQNKVQLCCTLYQWVLHVEAVDGVCMPTNECSKGGELLATGQLSNSSPTMITRIQHVFRQANFACHCTPLFTKQKAFCSVVS